MDVFLFVETLFDLSLVGFLVSFLPILLGGYGLIWLIRYVMGRRGDGYFTLIDLLKDSLMGWGISWVWALCFMGLTWLEVTPGKSLANIIEGGLVCGAMAVVRVIFKATQVRDQSSRWIILLLTLLVSIVMTMSMPPLPE